MTIGARPSPLTSDELYAHARASLPGGNSRTTFFVPPHPPYAVRGEGWQLTWRDAAVFAILGVANNALYLGLGYTGLKTVSAGLGALEARAVRDWAGFNFPL